MVIVDTIKDYQFPCKGNIEKNNSILILTLFKISDQGYMAQSKS